MHSITDDSDAIRYNLGKMTTLISQNIAKLLKIKAIKHTNLIAQKTDNNKGNMTN